MLVKLGGLRLSASPLTVAGRVELTIKQNEHVLGAGGASWEGGHHRNSPLPDSPWTVRHVQGAGFNL